LRLGDDGPVSVAIIGGDPIVAAALAVCLEQRGTSVVTVGDASSTADGAAQHLSCDLSSASDVQRRLDEAEAILDAQPAMIRLSVRLAQSTAAELTSLTVDEWESRAETPLREALAFHQAAQRFLAERSGRILVLVPTVGLSGGPGFVPLASCAEADRSLVKAQARVSGQRSVTINCIAVASALLTGFTGDPDRGGLPVQALPTPGFAQVADVIVGLLGPAFSDVTGQTIAVDGGRWMAP
jgi:3-oxoacyl-[acyl-carrier protein] reductase